MYCVIQEIETKKKNKGNAKELKVGEVTFTIGGVTETTYSYYYGEEHFIRSINKAYRISVHESHRENGKVKKKQVYVCTVGYYDIVDFGGYIPDFMTSGRKVEVLDKLGRDEDALLDLIDEKFQSIIDRVHREYEQTEEYKVTEKNKRIIKAYQDAMNHFADKYQVDREEYRHCYDVFGVLRNKEYLNKIKREYRERKEYEKQSRSYYEKYYDNHTSGSSMGGASTVDAADKNILKQFYRELSKKFHPDANPDNDTSEQMRLLNQLKSEWNV